MGVRIDFLSLSCFFGLAILDVDAFLSERSSEEASPLTERDVGLHAYR